MTISSGPQGLRHPSPPVYRTVFVVDIVGFSSRDATGQLYLRAALYRLLAESFNTKDVPWDSCYHEDRGDGALVIPPANITAQLVFDRVLPCLQAALRRHNRMANRSGRIRLRTAVAAGLLQHDAHGVSGPVLVHTYRLLDAPAFKNNVARARTIDCALITTDDLYQQLIRPCLTLTDPTAFHPLRISHKEHRSTGWINVPPPRGYLRRRGHRVPHGTKQRS